MRKSQSDYEKKPRDDFSHNVYSDDKKETLKTIRPIIELQSVALKSHL